ncbi:5-formyltetrahydrofolate cyclo-ligase [Desulfosoma caldarium]|uniref:5-formyltetrahydrofolate cyclo-ligase n=1 Tax=Desulfosoma caldarium TaxID=610254 RepID=A0A3N1VJV3_9BACT|nr:5-formyltetrahydrofolate cyclo-ligase [Desulfosoma caldarium]ROR03096.1 5-formyltetrahydrofolate cyclo-ligase [Desulfosoma caldarium]
MENHQICAIKNALREQFCSGIQATAHEAFLNSCAGKVAERLRRLVVYRNASCVLVPPTAFFRQIGVNVLLDGKNLVFASPKMHQGFYLVNPQRIPRPQRTAAASFRSPNPWAHRIALRAGEKVRVDVMVMPCLAASRDGGRLGDGSGLMDLQVACLATLGWLHARTAVLGVVPEAHVVDTLPMKPTDVFLHWIITEQRSLQTTWHGPVQVPIVWDVVDKKTLRRNEVLFFLKKHKGMAST